MFSLREMVSKAFADNLHNSSEISPYVMEILRRGEKFRSPLERAVREESERILNRGGDLHPALAERYDVVGMSAGGINVDGRNMGSSITHRLTPKPKEQQGLNPMI